MRLTSSAFHLFRPVGSTHRREGRILVREGEHVLSFFPLRKLLLVGLTTVLGLLNVVLAQPSASSKPKFTARAELVSVPVIVTDKSGAHIHNLAQADFIILEDGKEQKITSFEEIQKSVPLRHVSAQQGQFSNRFTPESTPAQLTILVFDRVNTPLEDQVYARRELLKYLADSVSNGQSTSLLAVTRDGIKVIHDFSTDSKVLAAALQNMLPDQQLVEEASQEAIPKSDPLIAKMLKVQREKEQQMESIERHVAVIVTLQAMQQVAQYCAGWPGRKALLWVTAGFPFSISETQLVLKIAGPRSDSLADVSELYEKTWKDLNQAQVAVYPIDVHGLTNPTYADVSISNPETEFNSHNLWKSSETQGTFQEFAERTGGRAFYNSNDLKNAFQVAADDNRNYYLLSYYLDRQSNKPGWHKLSVKVHRDGTQVRARSGFLVTQGDSEQIAKSEVQIALNSPLDYTAIPITGEWQQITPAHELGKKRVIFQLTMPADFAEIDEGDNNHFLVEFGAVARTGTGAAVSETSKTMDGHLKPDSVRQLRDSGLDYRGSLTLPPGEYTVHFAVRDHLSGRIGSVTASLKVMP
jgi:VWFA-related protein